MHNGLGTHWTIVQSFGRTTCQTCQRQKEGTDSHLKKENFQQWAQPKIRKESDLQFLNAILSLVTMAAVNLLLAVQIMLRKRSTLRSLFTFFSEYGLQLNGPFQSEYLAG